MTAGLVIDNAWGGLHGIGRYSREILSRLDLREAETLPAGSPMSLSRSLACCMDTFGGMSYTPGFNMINASPSRSLHNRGNPDG